MEEHPVCKVCGSTFVNRKSVLCLKCRSDQLSPCIYFENKKEGFAIPVPWCNKENTRIMTETGMKCRKCKMGGKQDG